MKIQGKLEGVIKESRIEGLAGMLQGAEISNQRAESCVLVRSTWNTYLVWRLNVVVR